MTKEETRDRRAAYYQLHKEERLAYAAAHYDAHKEEKCAYQVAWRTANPNYCATYDATHREEKRARDATYREANRMATREKAAEFTEWLRVLRMDTGCGDQGPHSGRLEHHHMAPSTKKHCVSEMANYSQETLDAEIAKCVVLCSSHHRKRDLALKALAA